MQTSFFKISFATLIISLLSSFSAIAAQEDYSNTWWVNLGVGAGGVFGYDDSVQDEDDNDGGIAYVASFNYALTNHQFLTVRSSAAAPDFINLDFSFDHEEGISENLGHVYDIGVLYGLMQKNEQFLASAAAGLAYTAIVYDRSELACEGNSCYTESLPGYTESTIGVPAEVQLFWTPTDVFGVGLIGLANINSEASYVAGLLAIQVGNLR